jgi:hypothetical protein
MGDSSEFGALARCLANLRARRRRCAADRLVDLVLAGEDPGQSAVPMKRFGAEILSPI